MDSTEQKLAKTIQIARFQMEWQRYFPEFFHGVEKLSEKYASPSEGRGFQWRVNAKTGAIETNAPMMKSLNDFSMPPLLESPDGEKGISYHILNNVILMVLHKSDSPMFIGARFCHGVPRFIPSDPKAQKEAVFILENQILMGGEFSGYPEWSEELATPTSGAPIIHPSGSRLRDAVRRLFNRPCTPR